MNLYSKNDIEEFLIENYHYNRKHYINKLYNKFNDIKWIFYTECFYKNFIKKIYVSNYGDLIIKKCDMNQSYYIYKIKTIIPYSIFKIYQRRNQIEGIELEEQDKDICNYIKKLNDKEIKNKIDERLLEKYENLMMKLNDIYVK